MQSTLAQEKLLNYDFSRECWVWNLENIQKHKITNLGVVELMVSNITKFSCETQEILKLEFKNALKN